MPVGPGGLGDLGGVAATGFASSGDGGQPGEGGEMEVRGVGQPRLTGQPETLAGLHRDREVAAEEALHDGGLQRLGQPVHCSGGPGESSSPVQQGDLESSLARHLGRDRGPDEQPLVVDVGRPGQDVTQLLGRWWREAVASVDGGDEHVDEEAVHLLVAARQTGRGPRGSGHPRVVAPVPAGQCGVGEHLERPGRVDRPDHIGARHQLGAGGRHRAAPPLDDAAQVVQLGPHPRVRDVGIRPVQHGGRALGPPGPPGSVGPGQQATCRHCSVGAELGGPLQGSGCAGVPAAEPGSFGGLLQLSGDGLVAADRRGGSVPGGAIGAALLSSGNSERAVRQLALGEDRGRGRPLPAPTGGGS